ncbi:MAG: hypothetical protein GX894_04485 [Clostridia bacterium]|nr:hypothetical protein [Clostridia bacterium]
MTPFEPDLPALKMSLSILRKEIPAKLGKRLGQFGFSNGSCVSRGAFAGMRKGFATGKIEYNGRDPGVAPKALSQSVACWRWMKQCPDRHYIPRQTDGALAKNREQKRGMKNAKWI